MLIFKKVLCFFRSMARESFLLVSLKEDKAKKLAQVISNESCRKILDFLTSKDATETELAKKLKLPISTVHYNLRHLQDAGLVTAEEFHYSKKGREVNHYKLANKYIIIAPKTTFGIKEKLKSALPVVLLIGAGAFAAQLIGKGTATFGAAKAAFQNIGLNRAMVGAAPEAAAVVAEEVVMVAGPQATGAAKDAFMSHYIQAAPAAQDMVANASQQASGLVEEAAVSFPSIAIWILVGAVAALALYFAVDYIRSRR